MSFLGDALGTAANPFGYVSGRLLGSALGQRGSNDIYNPDISYLYDRQRTALRRGLRQDRSQTLQANSADLAGRGVYSSPLSQWTVDRTRKNYSNALSQGLAGIDAAQANAEMANLQQIRQLQAMQQAQANQRRGALLGGFFGLAGAGLGSALAPGLGTGAGYQMGTMLGNAFGGGGGTPNMMSQWGVPEYNTLRGGWGSNGLGLAAY